MSRDPLAFERRQLLAATGKNTRVLVVDSGVETSHPAFSGRRISTWRVCDDCSIDRERPHDLFGHGSAVASIIAAAAPGTQLDSLRVLGSTLRGTSQRAIAALRWAVSEGYDVVNCSFGTASAQFLAAYKEAVDEAFCRNVLIVAAANNFDAGRVEYPSAFPTVLSTSHAKADDPLHLERRGGRLVEFAARGEDVRVAWKGGRWVVSSGSSFAAPHVTALAARIRELEPSWNACEVKAALYRIAAK